MKFPWTRTALAETVIETAPAPVASLPQVERSGYEYNIPRGGISGPQGKAFSSGRRAQLNELHQAYLACSWASTCIDTIARTVTAAGIKIVPDDGDADQTKPEPVVAVERLFKFTNRREDMIQLLRSTVTDLLVFGDAFIEVAWLLGRPVALWTLDAATMSVLCDEHGEVTGYIQDVDGQRTARFDIHEVIHISLDSPRGGIYGVSPTQKMLLPITTWLFVQACIKERFRRGDPHDIAVTMHPSMSPVEIQKWREQYLINNQGPRSQGMPVTVSGEGPPPIHELGIHKIMEWLDTATQLRDTIISGYGCTPNKVGVVESGNLGGGSGEAQDKTFRINTVIPIANLVLEKIDYYLLNLGFGIPDWHCEFPEVDMRDSKVVEEIRDMRLRNGSFTLNTYRAEIGQESVDGGDDAVLVDRQNMVLWADMPAMSKASVEGKARGADLGSLFKAAGLPVPAGQTDPDDAEEPAPAVPNVAPGAAPVNGPDQMPQGSPPKESAFRESYHERVKRILAEMDAGADPWTARHKH